MLKIEICQKVEETTPNKKGIKLETLVLGKFGGRGLKGQEKFGHSFGERINFLKETTIGQGFWKIKLKPELF